MTDNVIKGRDLILSVSEDAGVTWQVLGGIRTKDFTRDNPVSDTTSQSTSGGETESEYNGYSTVTLSGNGSADTRDTATQMGYKSLSTIANSTDPVLHCKLADAEETYVGDFNITSFGKNAEQNGKVEYSIALQNKGTVTYT